MPSLASTFGLDGWAEKAVLIAITVALVVIAFAIIRVLTPRLANRASRVSDPVKWQQRRTAVTLLATMLRYVALVGGLVAIAAVLVGAGGLGALGGSAVVAVVIAFASQRLLADIIAGFFILFEGQYGVGDVISVEPSKFTGIVEELGVRSTLLRGPDGSRHFIPNGQIAGVRRYPSVNTTLAVVLMTRMPDSAEQALHDLARLSKATKGIVGTVEKVEREDLGDGVTVLRAIVGAPAMLTSAAESMLVTALRAGLGDTLLADPLVLPRERTDRNLTAPVTA